jgi:predicted lipoprotein with Yx(FWY)xxD motif
MSARALRALLATGLVALGGVSLAGASAERATVSVARNGTLGGILVSASGRTLYQTSADRRNHVTCTGACAMRWPPLVIPARGRPVAGPGVSAALLGTVKRPGGVLQVTYRGLPLYLFSGDRAAGQANGQGLDGVWHAIAPSGKAVTMAAAGSAPGSSSSTGASSGSGMSGSSSSGSSGSSSGSGTGSGTSTTPPSSGAGAGMWCAANPTKCVNGVPVTGAG